MRAKSRDRGGAGMDFRAMQALGRFQIAIFMLGLEGGLSREDAANSAANAKEPA